MAVTRPSRIVTIWRWVNPPLASGAAAAARASRTAPAGRAGECLVDPLDLEVLLVRRPQILQTLLQRIDLLGQEVSH